MPTATADPPVHYNDGGSGAHVSREPNHAHPMDCGRTFARQADPSAREPTPALPRKSYRRLSRQPSRVRSMKAKAPNGQRGFAFPDKAAPSAADYKLFLREQRDTGHHSAFHRTWTAVLPTRAIVLLGHLLNVGQAKSSSSMGWIQATPVLRDEGDCPATRMSRRPFSTSC